MKKEIQDQIAELGRLYKEQDNIYRNAAINAGISDSMHWILYIVCGTNEPITQNRLAEEWFYPKQTINSAVQKLVKLGLVELVKIPGKRNEKTVSLTDEGKKFCERFIHPLIKAEKDAFLQLNEQERSLFLQIFRQQNDYIRNHVEKL